MKIIKKYTALKLINYTIDDSRRAELSYGEKKGPYYDEYHPDEIHDTEEEAINYAFKMDKYATWMIIPVIKFDNFD